MPDQARAHTMLLGPSATNIPSVNQLMSHDRDGKQDVARFEAIP